MLMRLTLVALLTTLGAAPSVYAQKIATPDDAYWSEGQEAVAIHNLAWWALSNTSRESPGSTRKEYGVKVLEIIKLSKPRPISHEMYRALNTEGQYFDGRGDSLFTTWLTMRALPKEVSRTSFGGNEIVIYQWQNANGSSVIGTFHNGFLVSKTQTGLQ
ncbi:MAG TPA: hypothetical protein VNJ02_18540 [Vicinamibacterales bacterium]|nr:hypothetical protein [Vicinamibacterales bacterium]